MKSYAIGACAAAMFAIAGSAAAEQWVDYTPVKGVTQIVEVKVEPAKIDDYITGLKKSWMHGQDIAVRRGLISDYKVMVKSNASDGEANVLLITTYSSMGALDPDQARDKAMEKEAFAIMSKDKGDEMVGTYNTYRSFVGDSYWTEVKFTK